MLKALGIDPGLRNTGVAGVIREAAGVYRSAGVRVLRTEKSKGAQFTQFRASADDQRRIHDLWAGIVAAIGVIQPNVIGIENYHVREPTNARDLREAASAVLGQLPPGLGRAEIELLAQPERRLLVSSTLSQLQLALQASHKGGPGLAQAARTIAVYGAALAAAFSAGVPVFVFEPSDRARRLAVGRGASKEAVGRAVEARIMGLQEQMAEKVPQKTLKEHAWDASALGMFAADEYARLRLDAGVN